MLPTSGDRLHQQEVARHALIHGQLGAAWSALCDLGPAAFADPSAASELLALARDRRADAHRRLDAMVELILLDVDTHTTA
jgi:hypothetical protein